MNEIDYVMQVLKVLAEACDKIEFKLLIVISLLIVNILLTLFVLFRKK